MKYLIVSLLFIAQVNIAFTQEVGALKVYVDKVKTLKGIPSASAMHSKNGFHYVACDDSPWLFVLDKELNTVRKFLIHDDIPGETERIPAESKPDYEAMVNYKWKSKDLLIFGSGSAEHYKTMVRVDHTNRGYEVKYYTLKHLYDKIMEAGNIPPEKFDIEGVASWRDHILFLNRGTNQLIMIRKFRFDRFMREKEEKQQKSKLIVNVYDFNLPVEDGVQARFSGAQKVKGEHTLLFSATLERNEPGKRDGEILGSYIGLIPLMQVNKGEISIGRVMKDGQPYTGKIESLDIYEESDTMMKIHAVTDNDQGTSTFLKLRLER